MKTFALFAFWLCSLTACGQSTNTTSTLNNPMNNSNTQSAIFASGCFWGTEYYMKRIDGVTGTTVGYTGGSVQNPSYKQVCTGTTGHYEAVKVDYDPTQTDYETLARMFFETHDPTQTNGQGPDIGPQYRSAIFYSNQEEKAIAEKLIALLEEKGLRIATAVLPVAVFYDAEDYHQDYYDEKGGRPYCHKYRPLF